MQSWILLLLMVVVPAVALIGMVKLMRALNAPDWERNRRIRMQGPFVPLSAEDIAEDERRCAKRIDSGCAP
ncbi:MAG: hypothetical protein IPG23_22775 [Burkholderiales bacterium]|jgi:hypothetical protein|nr:hypothetical protein [Burkholderiales bacterium]